jgi:curved DNA-binding protein CbpA
MKLDSKYFDSIRIKRDAERAERQQMPRCNWPGCEDAGCHKAPKGRGREGEYYVYCLEHVRAYNKSYNYFSGMSDEDVARYQKASVYGHRPTWSSGVNSWAATGFRSAAQSHMGFKADFTTADPFELFGMARGGAGAAEARKGRTLRNAERKALRALDLDEDASAPAIKARFKVLVKQHHPDINGGDKQCEDRLREVIQAYNQLKQAGFC